eukprot:TRINITY_DN2077_c0_g2_i6.p1 TRINITY_DN2077_c0_g2~~TRINITY_DN2077_c0_g2_i6.p1  ORF type:complete len:1139 (-),score=298.02 TRINITY_DN2077_c0_g2_i6:11-3427(-)
MAFFWAVFFFFFFMKLTCIRNEAIARTIGILSQLFIIAIPLVITIISQSLISANEVKFYFMYIIAGIVPFIISFAGRILTIVKNSSENSKESEFVLDDEESFTLNGFDSQLLKFLFPNYSNGVPLSFLYSIFAGALASGAVHFLSTSHFKESIDEPLMYFPLILSWFSFSTTLISIVLRTPPEPGNDHEWSDSRFSSMSRTIYSLLIFIVDIVDHGTNWQYSGLHITNIVLHWIFAFLPLIFFFGFLPSFFVFLEWGIEQGAEIFFGVPPASTSQRNILGAYYAIASASFSILLWEYTHPILGFAFLTFCAHLTSGPNLFTSRISRKWVSDLVVDCLHSLLIAAISIGLGYGVSSSSGNWRTSIMSIFFVIEIVLAFVVVLEVQLFRPFLFGVLRNPVFPASANKSLCYFAKALQILLPYPAMVVLFIFLYNEASSLASYHGHVQWWNIILLFRAVRGLWSNPHGTTFDISIFAFSKLVLDGSWSLPTLNSVPDYFYFYPGLIDGRVGFALGLTICSFSRKRAVELWDKLWLWMISLISSITTSKLRFEHDIIFHIANVILLPVSLIFILSSVALSSPLIPFLGIPFFILGYPRPKRVWRESNNIAGSLTDGVYYSHLIPKLLAKIQGTSGDDSVSGKIKRMLGLCVDPAFGMADVGTQYLFRIETRIVMLQVVERGRGYAIFIAKGLELKVTSCHNTEGIVLDDIIAESFPSGEPERQSGLNKRIAYAVTPFVETSVETYSISQMSLTGIIESHDFLKQLSTNFYKCLVANLSSFYVKNMFDLKRYSNAPQEQSTNLFGEEKQPVLPFPDEFANFTIKLAKQHSQHATIKPSLSNNSNLSRHSSRAVEDKKVSFSKQTPTTPLSKASEPEEQASPSVIPQDVKNHSALFSSKKLLRDEPSLLEDNEPRREMHLTEAFKKLSMSLYAIVESFGLGGLKPWEFGPQRVINIFEGRIPDSDEYKWLESHPEMKELVIVSYRQACKISFEETVNYETLEPMEFVNTMESIKISHYLGPSGDSEWSKQAKIGKPTLFSMRKSQKEDNSYEAYLNEIKPVPIYGFILNPEVVRGIWGGVSLELIYFTNDDDERYSIQAHTQLFRNLLVQSSEPPLGYPIFEKRMSIPHGTSGADQSKVVPSSI